MQVLADDGARIDACVEGREHALTVVMIHGFPFARNVWDEQRDALAANVKLVRIDLRGAGMSSVPNGPYLMEVLASDVAALLDALAVQRAALVGHSMGGYVALAFARMFTERLCGLALLSSRLAADTPQQAQARRALAERLECEGSIAPAVEAYLPRMFSSKTTAERRGVVERAYAVAGGNDPKGAAAMLRGMALRASSDDIAADLDVPVFVIAGGADRIVTPDESRSVAGRFSAGRLLMCEESGHLAMMEEPARVTQALAEWVSGLTG